MAGGDSSRLAAACAIVLAAFTVLAVTYSLARMAREPSPSGNPAEVACLAGLAAIRAGAAGRSARELDLGAPLASAHNAQASAALGVPVYACAAVARLDGAGYQWAVAGTGDGWRVIMVGGGGGPL
jgi:hypothetical protein